MKSPIPNQKQVADIVNTAAHGIKAIDPASLGIHDHSQQPTTSTTAPSKPDLPPTLQQTINKVTAPYLDTLSKTVAAYKAYNPSTAAGFSNMSPELQSAVSNMQKLTGKALTNLVPEVKKATEETVAAGQVNSLLNYVASRLVYGDILGTTPKLENKGVQGLYDLFNSIHMGGIGQNPTPTSSTGPASQTAAQQVADQLKSLGVG